jgi:RimJ/RimL family protein N-acetyltransferase
MKTLIDQVWQRGSKSLGLRVFVYNKSTRHAYEEVGSTQIGCVQRKFFREDEYIDETTMTKVMERKMT